MMEKKTLFLIMMLLPVLVRAYDAKIDGIYYNFNSSEQTATVTYYNSNNYGYYSDYSGAIVIPSEVTYDNTLYRVISIGEWAFNNCSNLTSITLPNSVTSIQHDAFSGCSSLTSIVVPNSVIRIGGQAFNGCRGLSSLIIPESVQSIGYGAFGDCSGLTNIIIPNSVTSIEGQLFLGCSSLTSVTIPNNVTSIGDRAFAECSSLSSIVIPDSITHIGEYAFRNCILLRTVTLPESVNSIGDGAFYFCNSLTSFTIPKSVVNIGSETFIGCSNLGSIVFHCKVINRWFNLNNSIKEVIIGNEVSSIGQEAFDGWTNLVYVTIGNGVTSIGDKAFNGCRSMVDITLPNSLTNIGKDAFSCCFSLTTITIPNNVRSIGDGAFSGCINLTSATIGNSVTTIGKNAFTNNLKKVIWLTNTPPDNYTNAKGAINYVSNEQYSSLKNTIVYPFLSSIFEVDGITYVPVSPSERTCDAIDSRHDEQYKVLKIPSKVSYRGIDMTVKNLRPYLFYNNKHMESALLGDLSNINTESFTGCFIGSNIKEVGNNSFYGCNRINNLVIADRDDELILGSNDSNPLFFDCPLDSIYIGGNITYSTSEKQGYSPFYRNSTLRTVVITDKETEISDNEFYGCTNLQNFTVGNGVEKFGDWAFSGCSRLQSLSFGTLLKSIGKEAFSDCSAVTKIVSKAVTPPTCSAQALDDINKWTCILYVPSGTTAEYQAADQWKEFFFMEETEASVDGVSAIAEDSSYVIYDEKGMRIPRLKPGINILRKSDGTVKKVIMK